MFLRLIADIARRGRRRADQFEALLPAEHMCRMVKLEQARVDYGGAGFTLLRFSVADERERTDSLGALVAVCKNRLRLTDEIGWLDEHEIGVLLPCTPMTGAIRVADDICLALCARSLEYEICCYPPESMDAPDEPAREAAQLSEAGAPSRPLNSRPLDSRPAPTRSRGKRRAETAGTLVPGGTTEDRHLLVASEGGL